MRRIGEEPTVVKLVAYASCPPRAYFREKFSSIKVVKVKEFVSNSVRQSR